MRSVLMTLAIVVLGTSVVGERAKLVIHGNEILSVCADDTDVEIVACRQTTTAMPPGPPYVLPDVEFSFPTVPSADMAKDLYIRSMAWTPGTLTVRLRFKDSKTAAAVAAFIAAQQTGGCNPPMPANPDGPYAMRAKQDLTRQ
jgi:hypothetical protein